MTAPELIQQFKMFPHPEGGWYKETYKSTELIPQNGLPSRFNGPRNFATAIYFLLEQGNISAFHRIKSDECWHFYSGGTLLVYIIQNDGNLNIIKLGANIGKGETFQYVVPANCWFASKPAPDSEFSFVGCTVSPGFDFLDFEMAEVNSLCQQYPQHKSIIQDMCKNL